MCRDHHRCVWLLTALHDRPNIGCSQVIRRNRRNGFTNAERKERYSAKTSQPRYMRLSTASVTNAVAWAASANVYGPGRTASTEPDGKTSASTTHEVPKSTARRIVTERPSFFACRTKSSRPAD